MIAIFVLAWCAALPFWEANAPADWTDPQLLEFLSNSPWAQQAVSGKSDSGVQVYLASAEIVREAEAEASRRARRDRKTPRVEDATADEYADFLRENKGKYIVLAVSAPDPRAFADPVEIRRMEKECELEAGGRKYKITGHFPPSPSDGWLRLVFPRVETAEKLRFRLYVPAASEPYRFAEFRAKELRYKGRLEM